MHLQDAVSSWIRKRQTTELRHHHSLVVHEEQRLMTLLSEEDGNDQIERFPLLNRLRPTMPRHHTNNSTTSSSSRSSTHEASLLCGLLAGVAQAGVFNPYDRALYLCVKEHRPFFDARNWRSPFTGFFQTLGGRAVSGGLFFPLEHFFLQHLARFYAEVQTHAGKVESNHNEPLLHFLAGTAAGAVNATVLNPLSAIKYKTWGREVNQGMWNEAVGMLHKGSLRPFFNGLAPTMYRDVAFGGCYTLLRLQIPCWMEQYGWEDATPAFLNNFVAACLATVVSGPFNYARNMQFATSSHAKPDSTMQILCDLSKHSQQLPTIGERIHYLQFRLRIGWGTVRVALGMTFAHAMYDWIYYTLYIDEHSMQ